MKCPHCRVSIHARVTEHYIGKDRDEDAWLIRSTECAACQRLILYLIGASAYGASRSGGFGGVNTVHKEFLIRPRSHGRTPCPPEVPKEIREDYEEAATVLSDSAKASAALSRRCLQMVLRSAAKVKPADLAVEIQQVLDSNALPSHLADSIDAIRNVGNFAAHPMKSQHTGEILPVEPGEAEWNLEVLESLFDFYYVQPAVLKAKRAALDKKLVEAGKPPLKGAPPKSE